MAHEGKNKKDQNNNPKKLGYRQKRKLFIDFLSPSEERGVFSPQQHSSIPNSLLLPESLFFTCRAEAGNTQQNMTRWLSTKQESNLLFPLPSSTRLFSQGRNAGSSGPWFWATGFTDPKDCGSPLQCQPTRGPAPQNPNFGLQKWAGRAEKSAHSSHRRDQNGARFAIGSTGCQEWRWIYMERKFRVRPSLFCEKVAFGGFL